MPVNTFDSQACFSVRLERDFILEVLTEDRTAHLSHLGFDLLLSGD